MTTKKILWTSKARKSFNKTYLFLIDTWGESIADKFLDTLELRLTQIATFPELAPKVNGTDFRQLVIHKNVSLLYLNEESAVRLLLIWDNRQDPKELAKKLSSL